MKRTLTQAARSLLSYRFFITIALYSAIIIACFFVAYEVRFDFTLAPEYQADRLRMLGLLLGIKLAALIVFGQTGTMLTFFSIPDFIRLSFALLVSSALMIVPRMVGFPLYTPPRGVLLVDLLLSITVFCAFRMSLRLYRERIMIGKRFGDRRAERIAIIGAGDAGASLATDLLNMPGRGFKPVAFLDDDQKKHGKFIHGVMVDGAPEDFFELKSLVGVRRAIIAMPSASAKRIGEIALFLGKAGVQVETLPSLEDMASGKARVSKIRPIEIQDLLGREPVALDAQSIRQFVENKVVMVTGAGGSIGAELCRQIAHLNPRRVLMIEQSEPSLFVIEQELNGLGVGGLILPLVADILDRARMKSIFELHNPQVVFHAAAHKHVYLMERQPSEAIKNNSVGTRKLAQLAVDFGAEAFVMISTDKAINPTNVMGASKRLAELHLQALSNGFTAETRLQEVANEAAKMPTLSSRLKVGTTTVGETERSEYSMAHGSARLTQQAAKATSSGLEAVAGSSKTKLMAVRFGNVLGSSGSVVPIFKKQIEAGGPVTVTHPDVIRYFMTIPEAVGLVMQASALGKGGEIFVLDMGKPVKIVDLARQMIELSGYVVGEDIEIKFTGLKPGEKLYEELQHCDERHTPTTHPRIMRFVTNNDAEKASRQAMAELEPFVDELSANDLKRNLKVLIPEYQPSLD
ncbi:MAG: polysaccharide biosynthesis protein [Verrucomicrobia bacterium]|nr:polysaccharide biosynthesis protein [Verrucomicrobiota bacterium]